MSQAATYQASKELEQGTIAGNASKVDASAGASGNSAVSFGGGKTGSCTAPAGLKVTDIDTAHGGNPDDPIPAWRHTLGSAAVIYFQTSGLPAEYAGYLADAASVWSASPCIDARAVTQCPASSNCVRGLMGDNGGDSYDGVYDWQSTGGYMSSGTITLVQDVLDQEPAAYRRLVVVHEMGHAVSLDHRLTKSDIMFWSSDESAPLKADATNLNNILAVYGVKSGATTTPPSGQANAPAAQEAPDIKSGRRF
jgi:hypothetical protein